MANATSDDDAPDQTPEPADLGDQYAPFVVSPKIRDKLRSQADETSSTIFKSAVAPSPPAVRVIIDPNFDHPEGLAGAVLRIREILADLGVSPLSQSTRQHVVAALTEDQITAVLAADHGDQPRAIHKVWPDNDLQAHLHRSVRLVKAEACARAFGAEGGGITWAVIDSGIDGTHPHFGVHDTLSTSEASAANEAQARLLGRVEHRSFVDGHPDALSDVFGHGTHVAGVIAGATPCEDGAARSPKAPGAARLVRKRDEKGRVRLHHERMAFGVTGVAPRCKLVSLKVLDDAGAGYESAILAALDYVDALNEDGRRIRIHGVNISIGYGFDAEWYAAGQSPVCTAVNRLVGHGVVVVVSAGNDGSVMLKPEGASALKRVGLDQSIADPGNAEEAITVGATHPDNPDTYGVSYFSSRGPTADGRPKPDIVAPGERILSCASGSTVETASDSPLLNAKFKPRAGVAYYREESGTSMAAPHVSGAAAAFLSIHSRYIGRPREVKAALMESATDLKRKRDFQGAGLLDVLRAIQSR